MSQSNRPYAPIIEDWVFDPEDESEVKHLTQAEHLQKDIPKSRGHKHSWNRKACFVCKSVNHLIKDCDYYEKKMVLKPAWNHAMRVNHQTTARMTHPHSKKHVVPTAVLTRSLDSSSHSVGPSRKRCRSSTTLVPISTPVPRSIGLALADLPPHKSETVLTIFNVKPSTTNPTKEMSQSNRPYAPIIEDWVFDPEDESEVKHLTQAEPLQKDIPKSRGHKHSWNKKACFVCKSVNHLIKDCDYYEKKMVLKPVWNHAMRVNHQTSVRMTHPHSKKHVVLTAVLTRSRLVPLNAARPVTTVVPKTHVKHQRTVKHVVNKPHSPIRRPINHKPAPKTSYFHQKVATVKTKKIQVSHGLGPQKTLSFLFDVRGNPQQALKDKEIYGGYVAFGRNLKGGKITGKDPQNTDADAAFDVKENESEVHVSLSSSDKPKKHDENAKREAKGKSHIDLSTGVRDLSDEFEKFSVSSTNRVNAASTSVTAVGLNSTNNTNSFNDAGPSDTAVSSNFEIGGKSSFVDPS
nr:hypothetical protein [Tanacetum cinerariifolium]